VTDPKDDIPDAAAASFRSSSYLPPLSVRITLIAFDAMAALDHPYGFDADIADKLETIHRDANFGAPSQRGFSKVKD
jgi:hypothetical protein